MKKFLLLSTIFVATGAFAFGGVGIFGHKSHHSSGVNSIGVHVNGEGKANIDILEPCPDGLERNTDGTCTVCTNGNVYLSYMDEHCQYAVSGNCASNKDCGEGEYCNLTSNNSNNWSCVYPAMGVCTTLGDKSTADIAGLGNVTKSNELMTWWAADNWCKAQGMRLPNIEDIGCYRNGTDTLVETNTDYVGYCCAQGQDCSWWGSYWDSNNIMEGYEDLVNTNYSSTIISLRQKFEEELEGDKIFWTGSKRAKDNQYTPLENCFVFLLTILDGRVYKDDPAHNYQWHTFCISN